MEKTVISLRPRPPYDFDLTASYAVYFRGRYGTESYDDGVFRRLLEIDGSLCLAAVRSVGELASPCLEVELLADSLSPDIAGCAGGQAAWILGIDEDLSGFYGMAAEDQLLSPIVGALNGLHVSHTASVYEGLTLAILGQQISSHVARMLRTLLIETYGPSLEVDGCNYHAFPSAEALMTAGVPGLRAIKFSTRKSEYIVDIAARVVSGALDLEELRSQTDQEVVRTLTDIRGVGEWTAQWLLIRSLGRADGFPYGDLALQRTLGLLVGGGSTFSPHQALEYSQRWSPFRSYVVAYLFAAIRSGRLPDLLES
jgi:DNA-3-methyladenine glycosylase II